MQWTGMIPLHLKQAQLRIPFFGYFMRTAPQLLIVPLFITLAHNSNSNKKLLCLVSALRQCKKCIYILCFYFFYYFLRSTVAFLTFVFRELFPVGFFSLIFFFYVAPTFQNIRTSIVKILKIRHNHHTEKQKKVQQLQQQQQQQSSRPAAAATTTTANHIDLTPSLPAHSLPSALPLPSTLTYKSDSTLTCLLQLECETCHHLSSLAEYYSSLRYNMLSSPSLSSPPTPTQSTQISPVFVECMTMVKGETEDQPLFCYSNDTFLLPLPQQERNPLEIQVTISLMYVICYADVHREQQEGENDTQTKYSVFFWAHTGMLVVCCGCKDSSCAHQ